MYIVYIIYRMLSAVYVVSGGPTLGLLATGTKQLEARQVSRLVPGLRGAEAPSWLGPGLWDPRAAAVLCSCISKYIYTYIYIYTRTYMYTYM